MKSRWKSLRVPIALASVCLVLLILLWAVLTLQNSSDSPDDGRDKTDIQTLIGRYPADKVSYLRILSEGVTYSFKKSGSDWVFVQDQTLPVRESSLESILSLYETLTAIRVMEHPDEAAEYGLDDPDRSLILVCDGEQTEFHFGNFSSYGGGYYFEIAGDSRLFLVDDALYTALDLSEESFFSCPTLPDRSAISKVTFTYPSGESVTVEAGENPPLFACLASLNPSRLLELGSDHDKSYGLDAPILCNIDCGEERILLTFGLGESDQYTYLRIGESKAVFLFHAQQTDALLSLLRQE